jgi:glycosyltransferase involved in cell wall biosynthesis
VVFHGRLAEDAFARRMAMAVAAVSASGHEAFGMAVADALTAGIPAVASFIPAHRELAVMAGDGVPLWLVNPDDEVALAEALRVAAATRRVTHGSNALPTWSDVVLSTREVYASVAPGARLTQGAADR